MEEEEMVEERATRKVAIHFQFRTNFTVKLKTTQCRYYYNRKSAAYRSARAIKLETTKYSYFIDEWRAIAFE